jgi:hypothetical protein
MQNSATCVLHAPPRSEALKMPVARLYGLRTTITNPCVLISHNPSHTSPARLSHQRDPKKPKPLANILQNHHFASKQKPVSAHHSSPTSIIKPIHQRGPEIALLGGFLAVNGQKLRRKKTGLYGLLWGF